jgi:hypothetical protein
MSNGANNSSKLPQRLQHTFAELEYDLWEAVVDNTIKPDVEYTFGFTVERNNDGKLVKETVLVTVSIKKA